MDPVLKSIPNRILKLAEGALTQANMHAAFFDPGNEHWDSISVINAAHAGELFLKAIIAKEHPLLIFNNIFNLDDSTQEIELASLIKRGRTHDFEKLPQVLWLATGQRLPHPECYERMRLVRNAIQHFCAPEQVDFGALALDFIYSVIDPLIFKNFQLHAIEYHEDQNVGYDYLVETLIRRSIKFSVPNDFDVPEIDVAEVLKKSKKEYRSWLRAELKRIGRLHLVDP